MVLKIIVFILFLLNLFSVAINFYIFSKHARIVDAFYCNTLKLRNDLHLYSKIVNKYLTSLKSNSHDEESKP